LTILSVVLVHFDTALLGLLPEASQFVLLSRRIAFRMDLFFLLSGFLIAYVYVPPQGKLTWRKYGRFLAGRVIRLYPAYLATLLVLIAGVILARALGVRILETYPWSILPIRLALLQAWPFLSGGLLTWNYPTWFLSALFFGYMAVFPLLWTMARRLRGARRAWWWVFAPLMVWQALFCAPWLSEFHNLMRVSCDFIAGGALFALYSGESRFVAAMQRHMNKVVLAYVVFLLVLSTVGSEQGPRFINPLLAIATPCLLAGAMAESSLSARLLTIPPLMALGRVSYSLFLSHAVAQKILFILLPYTRYAQAPASTRCLVVAAHIAVVSSLAMALYHLVEVPVTALLRKRLLKVGTSDAANTGPGSALSSIPSSTG